MSIRHKMFINFSVFVLLAIYLFFMDIYILQIDLLEYFGINL